MRTVLHRTVIAIAAIFATTMLAISGGATPAHAAVTYYFCSIPPGNSTTYCLNDWNNGGYNSSVKTYAALNSNEYFVEQPVGRCGGHVTSTCPFTNTVFDQRYLGFPLVQLEYQNSLCVAQLGGSYASLGNCNDPSNGLGGDNGTLFVDHNGYLINDYWTNKNLYGNNAACMWYQSLSPQASPVDLAWPTNDGCPTWFQSGVGN